MVASIDQASAPCRARAARTAASAGSASTLSIAAAAAAASPSGTKRALASSRISRCWGMSETTAGQRMAIASITVFGMPS